MISRAASRTSSERSSSTSPRPSISAFSFSRVRSDAGILSIGVLLRGGRSPNRTSLVRLIGRGSTPTLFPASLGLHRQENPEHRNRRGTDSPRHRLPPVLQNCSANRGQRKKATGADKFTRHFAERLARALLPGPPRSGHP